MISVKTIASGSSGNCYILRKDDRFLIIEAGINLKRIAKGTNYDLGSCDGCLISHEHGDHAGFVKQLLPMVKMYMSTGTAQAIKCNDYTALSHGVIENVGDWSIMPFGVQHDAREPLGFVISHGEDVLMFATDTYYIRPVFKGLTQIMIECNYVDNVLRDNIRNESISYVQGQRVLVSHYGLNHVKSYLSGTDLSLVSEIRLIHISNDNGDADLMVKEVQELTGIPTYAER